MARTIHYHSLFECDVREAASWYDRRSLGLGDRFIGLVADSVADAVSEPLKHAVGPAGSRYVRVAKFPYVVLFDANDGNIEFLGVMHTAQSIEKWRERTGPT